MEPAELAKVAARLGEQVDAAVFGRRVRMDQVVAEELRSRRSLTPAERRTLRRSAQALCRWHGWVSRLGLGTIEARLLVSTLLDEAEVTEIARVWARRAGVDSGRLFALGDAPDWGAKSQGLRRLLNNPKVATDPWLLFPTWLKAGLMEPPGDEAPKHKYVRFLANLQTAAPTWYRARTDRPEATWEALRAAEIKPWIVRGMPEAARFDQRPPNAPTGKESTIEPEDIGAQVIVRACDPSPGERWWVTHVGSGDKALHIADRMKGKGTVVATDLEGAQKVAVADRFRRAGRSNLMPKDWDGKHVPGRAGTYDGVLVEPASTSIGAWRDHPDARWLIDDRAPAQLADGQLDELDRAAKALRVGGALVYAVRTMIAAETIDLVERFSSTHPAFRLDPFPGPPWAGHSTTGGTLALWPALVDLEPAFVAKWLRVQ